jgi:hypothetical protein
VGRHLHSLSILLALLIIPFQTIVAWEVGSVEKIEILSVRPTQFYVGKKEISYRILKIEEKRALGELSEYKKKRKGRVVIGPGNVPYLIDGHHFALALHEAGEETMWVEVVRDYSDLTTVEFWEKLKKKCWCYLKDLNGNSLPPLELPSTLLKLKDDPYRSLAWMLEKCEAYVDLDIPFSEFLWAQFLRKRIQPWSDDEEGWKRALHRERSLPDRKRRKSCPAGPARRQTVVQS